MTEFNNVVLLCITVPGFSNIGLSDSSATDNGNLRMNLSKSDWINDFRSYEAVDCAEMNLINNII